MKEKTYDRTVFLLLLSALLTMALMTSSMNNTSAAVSVSPQETGSPADNASQSSGTPSISALPAVENPVCSGIIRFHVKANSDTEEDQALKLQVRNHVLAKLQNHLASCIKQEMLQTAGEAGFPEFDEARRLELTRQWLEDNLNQVEKWAEETVYAEGYDYAVTASLGITWIPEREYDGIYFPPGNYEALTLSIGEGAGQNWWCVLFPPLCLIDCGEELGQARFEAVAENRIILKSRILELLEAKSRC